MYWLNYLDRNAIAVSRLNNLEDDLNLSSVEYSTSVSILFVGYILGQIPSNMILTRVRPSWYMGGFMMAWALVSCLTALVRDYTGLVLTRFFLGVVEAPYYPGALYILSIFYSRKELATRISILYSGNIMATAFAGLIAAGVFEGLDDVAGLAGWRWLFILQGAVCSGQSCCLLSWLLTQAATGHLPRGGNGLLHLAGRASQHALAVAGRAPVGARPYCQRHG